MRLMLSAFSFCAACAIAIASWSLHSTAEVVKDVAVIKSTRFTSYDGARLTRELERVFREEMAAFRKEVSKEHRAIREELAK